MRSTVLSFCLTTLATLTLTSHAEAKLAEVMVTESGHVKKVELKSADVDAQIDFTTARVTYEMTFMSAYNATEGTFYFALPTGAYAHEFGMWVNDRYQASAIVEAQTGRVAFESMVRRGVDPALLEWTAGNVFKMRIYPLLEGKPFKVKLVVGMPLQPTAGKLTADLPLDFGKIERFSLAVNGKVTSAEVPKLTGLKALELKEKDDDDGVVTFAGSFKANAYLPPDSVTLAVKESKPDQLKLRREDNDERYFEAHAFPDLPTSKRAAPDHAVVYWDYSLSEAEHQAARLDALKKFLSVRKPKKVDLYGFQQHTFAVKLGLDGTNWKAVAAAVASVPYDGGTRLDHLLTSMRSVLPKFKTVTDVILFTNGIDSYELFDWKKQKSLASDKLNAFIVAPTMGANDAALGQLAKELGAVVIGQDQELSAATFNLLPWTIKSVTASKNLLKLSAITGDSLYPGDGFVLRGQVKKDGDASLTITVAQDGKEKKLAYKFDTDVTKEQTNTVPRLWAVERIKRLLPEKREHTPEITAMALKHQLMSPFTVMVVLETCEDYAEFKIDAPKDCIKRQETFAMDSDDDGFSFFDSDGDSSSDEMEESASEDSSEGSAPSEPTADASVSFDSADIAGEMKSAPAPAAAAEVAPIGDDAVSAEASEELSSFDDDEYSGHTAAGKDTTPRTFGFEKTLEAKVPQGANAVYAAYLKARESYVKIPYYYIFTADLFAKLKRTDLADLVLSNVVEVRPGEARWLRVYAYNLIAWGKAQDSVAIYRAVSELRGEDPQSFRDFGLAMEAIGQPVAAMRLFEKVKTGKWDSRLEGMNRTVLHDLTRTAKKALKTPKLSPENQALATKYAKADTSQNDKMVVTVSWDTDNTDIDLHVVEPSGAHVYYGNKQPSATSGRLNWDSTQGFGPEQYRNAKPMRGAYRVFLHYYARDRAALADGTFVRLDFKTVENGVEKAYTKTTFLRDNDQTVTVANLDYQDKDAKGPPADFRSGMARAKTLIDQRRSTEAIKAINALGKRESQKEEAQRHFHLARAQLHLKQYAEAELSNQRALALDPSMVSAHFNNACAASLAKDAKKAAHHLDLLADALMRAPEKRAAYLRLMKNDPDLAFVRDTKGFKAARVRLITGH